jgi:hypothetical protein
MSVSRQSPFLVYTIDENGLGVKGITGSLMQGPTNADGSIPFSGTLALTNSCISTLTVSGKIAGGAFAMMGQNTDGSTLQFTATINNQDTQINGTYTRTAGTTCSTDQGTVSLTKQ